jgi:ribonuclease BN (tRNA processing enzyme)
MADLRIVALGVGDYCSALYYSSCLAAVAGSGDWLLIDCPHPIRKILREASEASRIPLPLSKLVGIALTHLHADHCSGLEGLGAFRRVQKLQPAELPLFAGPKVAAAFRQQGEAERFDVREIAPGVQQVIGPFRLATHEARHGRTDAYAFQVTAGGRTFAHSGDTGFYPELLDWLLTADLVTHEVGADDEHQAGHTAYRQLEAWSEGQPPERWGKLRVIHYPDAFDAAVSKLEPARQGWVYVV